MSGTMYDYILEQPSALLAVFEHRAEDSALFKSMFAKNEPSRIYLIGSGSSLNAAKAAAPAMERFLNIEVSTAAASALPARYEKNSLFVFLSQGGSSTNTLAAIQSLRHYPHLAVTGRERCPVNECSPHILLRCGEEKAGPKTKGYLCTFFFLYCMALETARASGRISETDYAESISEAAACIGKMGEELTAALRWFEENAEEMKGIEKCVVIGKHAGHAAALESALKLQETLLIPAAGYEYEEFLHGPDMALDEAMAGLYLMPEKTDADYERFLRLIHYHRKKSPAVYTVGGGPELKDRRDLKIGESGRGELRLLSWCIPSQIMGARIPILTGKEGRGAAVFGELDAALNIKAKSTETDTGKE